MQCSVSAGRSISLAESGFSEFVFAYRMTNCPGTCAYLK